MGSVNNVSGPDRSGILFFAFEKVPVCHFDPSEAFLPNVAEKSNDKSGRDLSNSLRCGRDDKSKKKIERIAGKATLSIFFICFLFSCKSDSLTLKKSRSTVTLPSGKVEMFGRSNFMIEV